MWNSVVWLTISLAVECWTSAVPPKMGMEDPRFGIMLQEYPTMQTYQNVYAANMLQYPTVGALQRQNQLRNGLGKHVLAMNPTTEAMGQRRPGLNGLQKRVGLISMNSMPPTTGAMGKRNPGLNGLHKRLGQLAMNSMHSTAGAMQGASSANFGLQNHLMGLHPAGTMQIRHTWRKNRLQGSGLGMNTRQTTLQNPLQNALQNALKHTPIANTALQKPNPMNSFSPSTVNQNYHQQQPYNAWKAQMFASYRPYQPQNHLLAQPTFQVQNRLAQTSQPTFRTVYSKRRVFANGVGGNSQRLPRVDFRNLYSKIGVDSDDNVMVTV